MIRTVLTGAPWAAIVPHCLGRECDPGRAGSDPRRSSKRCFNNDVMTKIMARTGALGNLIDFRLLADQPHKLRGTAALGTAALIAGVFGRTAYCGSGV